MSRRLIACRYPTAEAAVDSWERLSDHFASERAAGIATMRCIGNSDYGETHMVVAAALSEADAELLELGPWGDEAQRCEDDIDRQLAQLSAGQQVDDELAKMKAELGQGGGGEAKALGEGQS